MLPSCCRAPLWGAQEHTHDLLQNVLLRHAAQVFSDLCRAGRLEDALRVAEAAAKAKRDDILIRHAAQLRSAPHR